MLIIGFLLTALVFFGHNLANSLSMLFLFRGLAGIGVGVIPGSLSALAWGTPLGVFTGIGALGFTLGNFLSGALKNDFLIFTTSALFCFAAFIISFFVKEEKKQISIPLFPYQIIMKNWRVYVPFLIRHSAAQAIWAIFPIYLIGLGANKFQIGVMYALNPFAQFIFMLIFDKYKSYRLIKIGTFFSTLTFLGYAISPKWQYILFLQILLGLSWGSLYLGSLKSLLENNLEQATSTGILSSVIGLAGILGPLVGGLICLLGLRQLLFASALLAAVAFLISWKYTKTAY